MLRLALSLVITALVLSLAPRTTILAAVASTGSVDPAPPAAGGTLNGNLAIGTAQINAGPFGSVSIDSGTMLEVTGNTDVGDSQGFIGELGVAGAGTRFETFGDLFVGRQGVGAVNVSDGGRVVANALEISSNGGGLGTVRIDGPQSFLSTRSRVTIGAAGPGRLELTNGGRFISNGFDNQIGAGTVTVDGAGSLWLLINEELRNVAGELRITGGGQVISQRGGTARIGADGNLATTVVSGQDSLWSVDRLEIGDFNQSAGVLTIEQQAKTVASNSAFIRPGSNVRLDGGTLEAQTLESNGLVSGHGTIRINQGNQFINEFGSILRVGPGEFLTIDGSFTNRDDANTEVRGGTLDIIGNTLQRDNATTSLDDGTILFRGGMDQSDDQVVASLGGVNNIFGDVQNGELLVTGESHMIFHDNLTNTALDVQPGSTLTVLGELMLPPTAGSIGLAGGGSAVVTSQAMTVGGDLDLSVAGDVTPGDRFVAISATGGLFGAFNSIDLPETPGVTWRLDIDPNSIAIIAGLAGDFNGDGVVNATDYAVWREALWTQDLAADANNDHVIDNLDYLAWRANFGATAPAASQPAGATPEPATLLLLFAWVALGAFRRSSYG